MIDLLDSKRDLISAACARHRVVRLDVFGSASMDGFRPGDSDVDFLIDFGPMEPYAQVDAYFGMLDDLRTLLGTEIDLVMVGAVKNRYIAEDIERTKRSLYAA